MKRLLSCFTFLWILFFSSTESWSADWRLGVSAYKNADYHKALRHLVPLAEKGHSPAQFILGLMYLKGKGVARDNYKALSFWKRAAEQNHRSAQYNLGVMYQKGAGVPKNYEGAVKWFQRAAEAGHAKAQFNLGNLYKHGRGVSRDFERALKWYRLAAENENSKERLLKIAKKQIVSVENKIAKIQKNKAKLEIGKFIGQNLLSNTSSDESFQINLQKF